MKFAKAFLIVLIAFVGKQNAQADWLTLPSRYSHDDVNGMRVMQYAALPTPTTVHQPLQSSGYTHFRSSLNYGQSADNYHRVEAWGAPVRPYGEWRFPYRPYSTPYPNWGPPYAGFGGIGIGFGGGVYPGGVYPGGGGVGRGPGNPDPGAPSHPNNRLPRRGVPNPAAGADGYAPYPSGRGTPYPVAPYYDGYHPNYRQ